MFFAHVLSLKMNAAFYCKYKLRGNFAVQFVSCEHLPHYTLVLALKFSILFEMEVGYNAPSHFKIEDM